MMKKILSFGLVTFSIIPLLSAHRRVLSLDGYWEIAQSIESEQVPSVFEHRVPVPGLVDMTEPPFQEVGKKSELRRYFWYRKTFQLKEQIPSRVILKIHKAKYGTAVFLNGRKVGEHLPCFTPGLLEIKDFLNQPGVENELIIRIGADRDLLPPGQPQGWDFEKYLYIPGIYDSVEIILSGSPHIANIQTVPDIESNSVRIVTEIENDASERDVQLEYTIREVESGELVGHFKPDPGRLAAGEKTTLEAVLAIRNCKLWSPDFPFLYQVEVDTGGDQLSVRFGMREFKLDRMTGRAILNGKPFFIRGSNVTIYRFFEDELRGNKPWDRGWVRKLHRKFKSMHWDMLRYCIGFPPDFWYDIADEEGFLLADEFPIWLLFDAPENPTAEKIIPEYREWMRERWNHPSVVIWDAQNESNTPETGKALSAVRHLDLSNRPWDNGWAEPQSPTDVVESHPYFFISDFSNLEPFTIDKLSALKGVPRLLERQKRFKVPIIINEYGWLWLQRNGEVTSLTGKTYERLLGKNSTTEQRRELYGRYLAGLTEFWRAHRNAAGVIHFCGLGYSRRGDIPRPEGGATSDHFIDLDLLTFEPNFEKYVRQAFNPIGIMADFWDELVPAKKQTDIHVYVINDLYADWEGEVTLSIENGGDSIHSQSLHAAVGSLSRQILEFRVTFPEEPGYYELTTSLVDNKGEVIQSFRRFRIDPVN